MFDLFRFMGLRPHVMERVANFISIDSKRDFLIRLRDARNSQSPFRG
jgi:hypothetical protein